MIQHATATGLDRLLRDGIPGPASQRIAVLANQASVDRTGTHLLQHLARIGRPPSLVLSPEHGLWGTHQDMEDVGRDNDPVFGLPVHSLYGSTLGSLDPSVALLQDIDLLVADLQDVGARYYTFAATLVRCMAAAAHTGTRVLVLDRPNPLGGAVVEGNLVEPGLASFVGEIPVPQRHGLTLGELALLARRTGPIHVDLAVLPVSGWDRSTLFPGTGLPWVPPSPNMPTPATALVYPGTCLVEGTNVSEGRGTTTPFEVVGAPFVDPHRLIQAVAQERVSAGAALLPIVFRPQFGKYAGLACRGVRIAVTDPQALRPLALGLALVKWLHLLFAPDFQWRTETYEFVSDRLAIDLLLGESWVRPALEQNAAVADVVARMEQSARSFHDQRGQVLLYP
jgi:uncharacterized protein YbbC (DUF1343 family)